MPFSAKRLIVSRARVVTKKDIMKARHARNNVRVLAIEWPQRPPPEPATNAITTSTLPPPAITTSEIPSNFMTSDDWETVLFPAEDSVFDNFVHELSSLL